ncbi:MAG TPA: TIGR03032 family protein [Rhodanobacteraceae bacterium]|nr:TIGR03032 family protein [Rhodanobacteraceae bacterium]
MSTQAAPQAAAALASQHTQSFPRLLRHLGVSLAVSTYQAGQLIVLRDQGETLNTHFVPMKKPMGMATAAGKLVVGGDCQVWTWRNMPAVAAKLEPQGRHDAALLPRGMHVTGDIDVHEMGFAADGELWLVNTRMSCLCTLADEHSVVPRWRPPFVSEFDLGDRCHLNGLAMRDGAPAYVTALGATDTPGGWRESKAAGGLLMRLEDEAVLARGLSMPHSPRWHDGRLWLLESGAGTLCTIDPDSGAKDVIVELPGFTRGIDFVGRYAFIGLSQVRETAVFAGLPLTERVSDRHCGVWVVDTRERSVVAYAIFTGKVQEVFAVTVLPWRYPALLELGDAHVRTSYSLPDESLKQFAKPDPLAERMAEATGLHQKKRLDEAITAYRGILEQSPEHRQARFQLGLALTDAEHWREAVAELGQVVARQPRNAEAHNSLGLAWARLANESKALEHFDLAIAADRQFALAQFNRGLIQLRLGRFAEGWEGYEWRWQMPSFTPFRCPQPQWNGEDISDKVLLVHTEQGNGDAMQFARFLPMARARCRKLLLVCTANMKSIMATADGIDEIREPGQLPSDSFDVYCPLLSLPRALGITLANLPASVPYLSVPPRTLVPALTGEGFKVGLVWTGSPTQKDNHLRSCPLEQMLRLADVPGVQCYSLQKPLAEGDAALLESHGVVDLEKDGTGYGYTAAYVEQLDLVISVCTSVAHLAGALGRPVWVPLPHYADWRWGTGGETTPWYPTMRLLRQRAPGDWPELMGRVREALSQASRATAAALPS